MFPGVSLDWGGGEQRGATLLSIDTFAESIDFVGRCLDVACFGGISHYDAPPSFSIATWGKVGSSQSSVAAADFANTLHFDFSVLDASGQPTDIPVSFTLAAVPEPAAALLALAGLVPLPARWRPAARRSRQAAAPPA